MRATISILSVANGELHCSVTPPSGPPPILFSVPCDAVSGLGHEAGDVVRNAARRAVAASMTEGPAADLVGRILSVDLDDPPAAPTLSLIDGILSGRVVPGTRRVVVRLAGLPDHSVVPNQDGDFSLHVGGVAAMTIFAISDAGLRGPASTIGGGAGPGPIERPVPTGRPMLS